MPDSGSTRSQTHGESEATMVEGEQESRSIHIVADLKGLTPVEQLKKSEAEWEVLILFSNATMYHTKWIQDTSFELLVPIDLFDPSYQQLLGEHPLIILLRIAGGKERKDPDQLTHPNNRAGGVVDLWPLALGAKEVRVKVNLVTPLGYEIGCSVDVLATWEEEAVQQDLVPLVMTMMSLHCVLTPKPNTVYVSALGLDGVVEKTAIHFGMSLSDREAKRCLWATACTGDVMIKSDYAFPDDDVFEPLDLERKDDPRKCVSYYWHTVNRVLVDTTSLRERLESGPLVIEVAGVPRTGKQEVRDRYIGLVDAKVLLHPNITTVIVCTKLNFFNEEYLAQCGPMLDFPPSSAKRSAKTSAKSSAKTPKTPVLCEDMYGHTPYIVIKFDLPVPLVQKMPIPTHFNILGFEPPEKKAPLNELYVEPPPEDPTVDVRRIRKECGALSVHKELSNLTCRGLVPMNQGIKKTAANKLLTRVRTMLRQFPPEECPNVELHDTITRQHAASRRAVTASFRPQPPPVRPTITPFVPARDRMAGDIRLYELHLQQNLEALPDHPRSHLSMILFLLDTRRDSETTPYLQKALELQTRSRHLLWLYGALRFELRDEDDYFEKARSAFTIAVKGDYSDGVACTIGWAALHVIYHYDDNEHGAFVSARRMRKSHELPRDWEGFYKKWLETSGEEEWLWTPEVVSTDNPFLTAAAYFLVLRCFNFSERLLKCLEEGCATRGSRLRLKTEITPDVYYLRAASLLLRTQPDEALSLIDKAIRMYGPSPMMSALRATACMMAGDWDAACEGQLNEAERWGAKISYGLLLEAARLGMKDDPETALQRAARVHKARPSAHSALVLACVYMRRRELVLAEKWAAAAVKLEPLLADGWAVLALLAIGDRDVDKARAMLRTAYQAGPISGDIQAQLAKVMKIGKCEHLADLLVKNLCFCESVEPVTMEGENTVQYLEQPKYQ